MKRQFRRLWLAAGRVLHPWRTPGRGRLVHGVSGLEGRTESAPIGSRRICCWRLFLFSAHDLDRARPPRCPTQARPRDDLVGSAALAVLFVQLMLGAWVAGFRAGYVSNTWPEMGGRFVPEGIDWSNGLGFAMTHDLFLLHFMHRWWAWVVVAVLVVFARKVRKLETRAPRSPSTPLSAPRSSSASSPSFPGSRSGWRSFIRPPAPSSSQRRSGELMNWEGSPMSISRFMRFSPTPMKPNSIGRIDRRRPAGSVRRISSWPSARSTAGRVRSRRPTKSRPSSRPTTGRSDALIERDCRAPQLRCSLRRRLAHRQDPRTLMPIGSRKQSSAIPRLLLPLFLLPELSPGANIPGSRGTHSV